MTSHMAQRTAANGAAVASKRLMRMSFEATLDETYAACLPLLAECLASPEVEAAGEAWRRRRAEREAR